MTSTTLLVGFDTVAPTTAVTTAAGTASGALGLGLYSYVYTFVTAYGETTQSAASIAVATTTGSINILTLPVSADPNVTSRNIYRTTSGGATYAFLLSVAGNNALTTTIVDTLADGSLGVAVPASNTASSREVARGWLSKTQPSLVTVVNSITANAAGTQAAGTPITGEYNVLTTVAGAGHSVTLPLLNANLVGMRITIKNNGANACNVFPALGQQINALGANTAFSLVATAVVTLTAITSSLWITF